MKVYCIEDFKVEFEKLISKKQYKSLQQEIVDYFFNKSVEELSSGTRLNNSSDAPYIKKDCLEAEVFGAISYLSLKMKLYI